MFDFHVVVEFVVEHGRGDLPPTFDTFLYKYPQIRVKPDFV